MRVIIILNLAAFSVVASQPISYLIALGESQRALSAPAYIELRQRINPLMNRRLPVVYVIALALGVTALIMALLARNAIVVLTGLVAIAALAVDVFFMLKESVPVNDVMDAWTPDSYPADWAVYRAKWFAIFAYRQVILLVGYACLLFGAVYGTAF